MSARVRGPWFAVALLIFVGCSGNGTTTPPPTPCSTGVGAPITLAVGAYTVVDPSTSSDCVQFPANASASESTEYLVIAQSAAGTPGQTSPFRLQGGAAAAAAIVAAQTPPPPATRSQIAVSFDQTMRRMERTRSYPLVPTSLRTAAAAPAAVTLAPPVVGSLRVFKVCGNLSCSTIKNVAAKVRVVGLHIAVYVDTLAPAGGLDSAQLDSLKQVFDTRLYPIDTAAFGGVSDIDSNSVVIVLMTGVVNSLVSKTQCQQGGGYVAGFFFAGDLDPTFASQFNHGEVFYSIVADPNGTLSCAHPDSLVEVGTPVTFVHELQHMISFVQHVLVRGGNSEEGWLDEGLSKYAEELAGRSYLPGDPRSFSNFAIGDIYDSYQYLLSPSGSPLLIPQDTGSLPEIGASWLFTRYLIDQFGAGLALKLHQTTLVGSANVAAQTGQPFTTLVTRWALANWVSDLPAFSPPSELQYTSWHFRTTFGSLHSQDSSTFTRPYPLLPAAGGGGQISVTGTLTSGSGAYARLFQPFSGAGFSLRFTRDGSAALSAALVPRLDIIRIR